MYKHEIKNNVLYIAMPENFQEGFVSSTGKSFCYKVAGFYLTSQGYTMGTEGKLSPYLYVRFYSFMGKIAPASKKALTWNDLTKHDFDGIIMAAIAIPLQANQITEFSNSAA